MNCNLELNVVYPANLAVDMIHSLHLIFCDCAFDFSDLNIFFGATNPNLFVRKAEDLGSFYQLISSFGFQSMLSHIFIELVNCSLSMHWTVSDLKDC